MRHANRQVNDTRLPVQQRAWKRKNGKRSKKYAINLLQVSKPSSSNDFDASRNHAGVPAPCSKPGPEWWIAVCQAFSSLDCRRPQFGDAVWQIWILTQRCSSKNYIKLSQTGKNAKWLKRQQSKSNQNSKRQAWPNKKIECCASHPRFWIPDRSCASVIVIPSSKYRQTRSPLTTNGCAFRSCFNARADFRKHWPGMLFQRCTTTANPMQTIWWKVTGWLDMLDKHDTQTTHLCLA